MDKFQENGLHLQFEARNITEADKYMERSCTLCTMYHRWSNCEACPIARANDWLHESLKNKKR